LGSAGVGGVGMAGLLAISNPVGWFAWGLGFLAL